MGLKSMSLLAGATIAATGGSALDFAEDGVSIMNGLHLIVPGDLEYQTRRQLTAKYRPPTLDVKSGSYGKDKKSISFAFPMVLADGRVVFNTIRLEREVHPQFGALDAKGLNIVGAQLLTSTDVENFWATGALS